MFTLADVAWAPVLGALEFADWWKHIDVTKYPCVVKYWSDIKCLPSFVEATKPMVVDTYNGRHGTSEGMEENVPLI